MYIELQREHQKVAPFVIMFQQIEVAAHRKSATGFIVGPGFSDNWYMEIKKN
jgi:peptide/nickel transport system substrate-binding protein